MNVFCLRMHENRVVIVYNKMACVLCLVETEYIQYMGVAKFSFFISHLKF